MNKKFFLLLLFSFFLFPKLVFAEEVQPGYGWIERSTYFNNTDTLYQVVDSQTFPYTILYDAGNNSDRKGLYGFRVDNYVSNDSSKKYTKLLVKVDVEQNSSCAPTQTVFYKNATAIPVHMVVETDKGRSDVACTLTTHMSWKSEYTCQTLFSDYEHFDKYSVYVGCLDGSCTVATADGGGVTDSGCHPNRTNTILARTIYDITSTSDPNLAQLNNIDNSINNQTTIINGSIQDVNNSVNDDNFSDKSGFSEFINGFDSFENNSLTSIITSPISFINSLDDTCQPVPLDLLGTTINIPCGDTVFWGRSDVSGFRVIWNLLLGGPIIYFLLVKLYKVVDNSLRPDKDEIETYI